MDGTPHNLTEADWQELTGLTDGYSGADIEILCKDAAMEPLRFAQATNKFRKVVNHKGETKYMPADKNAMGHDIITSSIFDLPDRSLDLGEVSKEDFIKSLKRTKATNNKADLKQFEDWTAEFGEEG